MIMDNQILAATNFINKTGKPIYIDTNYMVSENASAGESTLWLSETFGILDNSEVTIGQQDNIVIFRSPLYITLKDPLVESIAKNSFISNETFTKCIPMPAGKDITRDQLEFNKRIRVPKGTLVNYGSKVNYMLKDYFVTGLDDCDTSLSLKLRSIDVYVDIQREGDGEPNGFGLDPTWNSIQTNIPAYSEHMSSQLRPMEGAGYIPGTYQMITIPNHIDVTIGDRIVRHDNNGLAAIENTILKVIGLDRYRVKNLLTLLVDYDVAR